MKCGFVKFPTTPHLAFLGRAALRGDKAFSESEREEFLQSEIIVEEKIDGANLGISFDSEGNLLVQNRGGYLVPPLNGQWKKLKEWLSRHVNSFFDILMGRYIVFGEWCYARHSIFYNKLTDWFLGFDIYDRKRGKFLSVPERNIFFPLAGIQKVPEIQTGRFTLNELAALLTESRIGETSAEGLYLRVDSDSGLERRAKLVRPEFIQSIERHWSKSRVEPNKLVLDVEHEGT